MAPKKTTTKPKANQKEVVVEQQEIKQLIDQLQEMLSHQQPTQTSKPVKNKKVVAKHATKSVARKHATAHVPEKKASTSRAVSRSSAIKTTPVKRTVAKPAAPVKKVTVKKAPVVKSAAPKKATTPKPVVKKAPVIKAAPVKKAPIAKAKPVAAPKPVAKPAPVKKPVVVKAKPVATPKPVHHERYKGVTNHKEDLVLFVMENFDMTHEAAKSLIDTMFIQIHNALVDRQEVVIPHFGKFLVKESAQKEGVNPATGEHIIIPAKGNAKFKPAKQLKDLIDPNRHSTVIKEKPAPIVREVIVEEPVYVAPKPQPKPKPVIEKPAPVAAPIVEEKIIEEPVYVAPTPAPIYVAPVVEEKPEPVVASTGKGLYKDIENYVNQTFEPEDTTSELAAIPAIQENPYAGQVISGPCELKDKEIQVVTTSDSKIVKNKVELKADKFTDTSKEDKELSNELAKKSSWTKKMKARNFWLAFWGIALIVVVLAAFVIKLINAGVNGNGIDSNFLLSPSGDQISLDVTGLSGGSAAVYLDYVANVLFILATPLFGIIFIIDVIIYVTKLGKETARKVELVAFRSANAADAWAVETTSYSEAYLAEKTNKAKTIETPVVEENKNETPVIEEVKEEQPVQTAVEAPKADTNESHSYANEMANKYSHLEEKDNSHLSHLSTEERAKQDGSAEISEQRSELQKHAHAMRDMLPKTEKTLTAANLRDMTKKELVSYMSKVSKAL